MIERMGEYDLLKRGFAMMALQKLFDCKVKFTTTEFIFTFDHFDAKGVTLTPEKDYNLGYRQSSSGGWHFCHWHDRAFRFLNTLKERGILGCDIERGRAYWFFMKPYCPADVLPFKKHADFLQLKIREEATENVV